MSKEVKKQLTFGGVDLSYDQKTAGWFLKFGLVGLILIFLFVYLGISDGQFSYYLAAGMVVAGLLALFSQAKAKNESADLGFTEEGLLVSGKVYPWDSLRNFWIDGHSINFEKKRRLSLPLIVPLDSRRADEVRQILLKYLPEKTDGGEIIFDLVNRFFHL